MCYESLSNGDVTDHSVIELLRRETGSAVRNGLGAAVIVVAVLLWRSVDPQVVSLFAVGAVLLGAVIHQLVLFAGIQFLRRRPATRGPSTNCASHD